MRRILPLALLLLLAACSTTSDVEGRETRVNVWLTAPHLAKDGGTLEALIYVGPYKVVEGPVAFPKGTPTVNLTPLFIGSGSREVSVVLAGGRFSARETVQVERESWIQVVLVDGRVGIKLEDEQPDPWAE